MLLAIGKTSNWSSALVWLACAALGLAVILEPNGSSPPSPDFLSGSSGSTNNNNNDDDDTGSKSFEAAFRSCLAKNQFGTVECVNRGALSRLQALDGDECMDWGDVRLQRAEGQSRDLFDHMDWDPKSFGNVVRAASRVLERRSLKWDLSGFYPGLQLKVGPTLNNEGVIEFAVDENVARQRPYRNVGTGTLLMRQLVLPFLQGFKFDLASLLPLLFGALILITKKAVFLGKAAIFIAGLLGWNSLLSTFTGVTLTSNGFSSSHPWAGQSYPSAQNYYGQDYQSSYSPSLQNYYASPSYGHQPYRDLGSGELTYPQHIIRELVNVYDGSNGNDNPNSHSNNADMANIKKSNDEPVSSNNSNNRKKKNFVWNTRD